MVNFRLIPEKRIYYGGTFLVQRLGEIYVHTCLLLWKAVTVINRKEITYISVISAGFRRGEGKEINTLLKW